MRRNIYGRRGLFTPEEVVYVRLATNSEQREHCCENFYRKGYAVVGRRGDVLAVILGHSIGAFSFARANDMLPVWAH